MLCLDARQQLPLPWLIIISSSAIIPHHNSAGGLSVDLDIASFQPLNLIAQERVEATKIKEGCVYSRVFRDVDCDLKYFLFKIY